MVDKPSEDSKNLTENILRKILLIGVGNEYRNDDGIGLMVARAIRKKQLPCVIVKEESGEGAALMEAWQGFQNVIIVDAVSSGAMPGTIFRIDAKEEAVSIKFFHYSTHAFSVAEAVELARAMNSLPPNFIIYGIEGKDFAAGTTISASVRKAAKQAVRQIVTDVEGTRYTNDRLLLNVAEH
jgi:hydrogenase maturation protease